MEKSGSDKIATTMNILKLPYYLLIVSGHTLSTDGVTLSRRMVVFSGAIFLFNSILLVKNLTCLDKDIQSVRSIENLCSTMYQIVMLIVVSVTLFDSLKQVPLFVKKLEKLNELIDKESLRNEIQTTVKWMTVVGFVFSTTMAVVVPLFKLLMYSSSSWDHCPIHRSLFNSPRVYDHVSMFLNVATANVAFQGVAGMTLFVSMCSVLALFFKHLHAEIKRCGGLLHMRIDSETGGGTEQKPPELIQRIRTLYEYTCELTEILDDVITVQVGLQLVVGIPMISFTTYNTFVPEFRVDFMFYGLFVFFYSLIYLLATVNVNSQAHSMAEILHKIDISSLEDETRQQISSFLQRIYQDKIGISVFKLFVVYKSTIVTIWGTVLTYFIVMVQFRQIPAPEGLISSNCNCTVDL